MTQVQKKKETGLEGPPVPVKIEEERSQEIRHTVPTKVETQDPFLENLHAELVYLGFEGAGEVFGGRVGYDGAVVDLGLGVGMLDVAERKPILYISPSLEVNGEPGKFDIYGNIHMALLPGNEDITPLSIMYAHAGAVWRAIEPKNGTLGFRLGVELKGEVDIGERSVSLEIRGAEIGAALDYNNATFYAIEEVMFHQTDIKEGGWGTITPQQHNVKGGLKLELEPAQIEAQVFYNELEVGGMLAVSTDTGRLIPEVYATFSHGRVPFLGDEILFGARVRFGGRKKQLALSAAHGFGNGRAFGTAKRLDAGLEEGVGEVFEKHLENAETFEEFSNLYARESIENVLYAAQTLGRIAKDTADEELWEKIIKKTGLSQEYQDAVGLSSEELYSGLRDILLNGSTEQDRIWACVAISALQATLFRKRGMETYLLGFTMQGASHAAVVTQNPETKESYLISFNDLLANKSGTVWPLLKKYAEEDRSLIRGFYLYGEKNKLVGYYETPEGKMIRKAAGAEKDPLEERLTRRKRK